MKFKRPRRPIVYIFIMSLVLISGCSSGPKGFGAHSSMSNNLPGGVPQKIVIAPFSGDVRITGMAMELIADGMHNLGFEVIPWSNMKNIEPMTKFPAHENIDSSLRQKIGNELGVDGIMLGRATSESEMFKSRSYLDLKMIAVTDGEVLWKKSVRGSKQSSWNHGFKVSVEKSIKKSLKTLSKDMKKYTGGGGKGGKKRRK